MAFTSKKLGAMAAKASPKSLLGVSTRLFKENIRQKLQDEMKVQLDHQGVHNEEVLRQEYEDEIQEEKTLSRKYKDEKRFMERKINDMQMACNERNEEMLQAEEEKLHEIIKALEQDIAGLKVVLNDKDKALQDKKKCLQEFEIENENLENTNKKLVAKAKVQNENILLKKENIAVLEKKIDKMEKEMLQFYTKNKNMEHFIEELTLNLKELQVEKTEMHTLRYMEAMERNIKLDLESCMKYVQDPEMLKESTQEMYKHYATPELEEIAAMDADIHREFNLNKEFLEKKVGLLKTKLDKNAVEHRENKFKMITDNMTKINELKALRKEWHLVQDQIKRYVTQLKYSKQKRQPLTKTKTIKENVPQSVPKMDPRSQIRKGLTRYELILNNKEFGHEYLYDHQVPD